MVRPQSTTTNGHHRTEQSARVSICTLTHNRSECLSRLQRCIEEQTYPLHQIEWLILDDSSSYKEALELKSKTPITIKYQRLKNKLTLGAKRNLSHKLCSGDVIVYMDDDDFYFPNRVQHAVNTLKRSNRGIAGCTHLHIYFSHDDQLWLSGPFGSNHATAGTFAMTRQFAGEHFYDNTATCNEEKSFLQNYTIPLDQLDPLQTMICISHHSNTFDKRRMRRRGATRRMQPLSPEQANPLRQQLRDAGFLDHQQPLTIQPRSNVAPETPQEQELPSIALICGPWGSGTSALCALVHALGVHAQGPFFQTNDPRTPACFEMLTFNRLVNQRVDETTLERKETSQVIQARLTTFRDQHFSKNENSAKRLELLKTPASSALLPELQKVFSLHLLICLRERKAIEASRKRRRWPAHLGKAGAERIYSQIIDFTASSDCPALFIRQRDIIETKRCRPLINRLASFLQLQPSEQQRQRALQAVAR